jgi:HSP20 family protein
MAYRDRKDTAGMPRRTPGSPASPWRDPYGPPSGGWTTDPVSQFRRLSDQMDRWFDAFGMGRGDRAQSAGVMNMWAPEMETFLRDDRFVVRVDLPGLTKDEVNVEVTDDSVVIHGERQQVHEEQRDGYYRSERNYGRFYREVPLPEGAQPDSAQANYRDGVLEVTMTVPPRELHRPRRIEIGGAPTETREREQAQRAGTQTHTPGGNVTIDRTPGGTPAAGGSSPSRADRSSRATAHDKPPRAVDTE